MESRFAIPPTALAQVSFSLHGFPTEGLLWVGASPPPKRLELVGVGAQAVADRRASAGLASAAAARRAAL